MAAWEWRPPERRAIPRRGAQRAGRAASPAASREACQTSSLGAPGSERWLATLDGLKDRIVRSHEAGQLGARADSELAERVVQVELDCLRTEEERRGRLSVRLPLGDDQRDLELLRCQLVARGGVGWAQACAGGSELCPGARAPRDRAQAVERLSRGLEVL